MAKPGERLLAVLAALANAHRLRIIAVLSSKGRIYVSQLAREVGISRPLLHLHLQKLQAAGLVSSKLELSSEGKALNYFEVTKFAIELTPSMIVKAAASLPDASGQSDWKEELEMSDGDMSTVQYLLFVSPFVVTILLVFGMKYFSALFQARARIADDAAYRALAERVVGMESELYAVRAEISKVASSLAVVEKILQQVE